MIPNAAIIATFYANVHDARLIEELTSRQVCTITELYLLADRYALSEGETHPDRAPWASTASRRGWELHQAPDELLQEFVRCFS